MKSVVKSQTMIHEFNRIGRFFTMALPFTFFIVSVFMVGCRQRVDSENKKETPPATMESEAAKNVSANSRIVTGRDGVEMVYIPSGVFFMGSDTGPAEERPKMNVFLEDFYIDRVEISNERFTKFMEETGHKPGGGFHFDGKNKHRPATRLTWKDVESYCRWAGKRLPTEYEWEKAARGVDGRIWPWGNDEKKPGLNESGSPVIYDVFDDPWGQSPYGCLHMSSNAREWIQDWLKAYVLNTEPNPLYGEKYKVLRGGFDVKEKEIGFAPVTRRHYMEPNKFDELSGGRCAMDPD